MRILIVEDDRDLAAALDDALRFEGYATRVAYNGLEAVRMLAEQSIDIVLLDRDLPIMSGDAVMETIASNDIPVSVLMLTAAAQVRDRINGLELGADDYLIKPFAYPELLARIRALQRRAGKGDFSGTEFSHNGIVLDTVRHTVTRDGKPVNLSPKEYGVLLEIMKASRVSASDILSGTGTGSGSEDFYSPGIKYRAYSRGLNKEYDKTMVVLLDSSGNMRVVPQVWNNGYGAHGSNCAFTKLGFTAEGLLWISDDRGVFYYDPEAIMAVAEDRGPVYSWSPSELVTGDDIPYVMLVRGYRAEKRIAVLWSTLPADWDGWSMLPGDTTIHAAVLDSTGQLQNDWDTKINPGCYEEGGPVRLYSNEQKDGYLCFYVDSKHGTTGSADYELNLATGEVNRT
jgi:two-component system OmpR family response regulator